MTGQLGDQVKRTILSGLSKRLNPHLLRRKLNVIQFPGNEDVEIAKMQRLKRKRRVGANGEAFLQNTSVVKLFFLSKKLPDKASIYGIVKQVTEYIPRPMICYNCSSYGYQKKNCLSKYQKCQKCGSIDHTKKSCNKLFAHCYNCGGKHEALSKNCPQWKFNQDIIKTMVVLHSGLSIYYTEYF